MSKTQRVKIKAAVKQYMESERIARKREGTKEHHARTLRILAEIMGDLNSADMTVSHVDRTMARLRLTRSETTLNIDRTNLRGFVTWLHDNNMLSPYIRPTAELGYHYPEVHAEKVESLILTPEQAADALDKAGARHPRDRILVALGLYAFVRESELIDLVWENIHLDEGYIEFRRRKSHDAYHRVPIFLPLRAELEKWTAWLEEHHGPIQPTDHVVPARKAMGRGRKLDPTFPVIPDRAAFELTPSVKPILDAVGFVALKQAGIHTLRRTGACHFYDALVKAGEVSDPLGLVQRMLGHKNRATTERYLRWWEPFNELSELAETYDPYNQAPKQEEQLPSNVFPIRRVS